MIGTQEETMPMNSLRDDLLKKSLDELALSTRVSKCLKGTHWSSTRGNISISNIGDLVKSTAYELLKFKNAGRKTIEEIEASLIKLGLHLANRDCQAGPGGKPCPTCLPICPTEAQRAIWKKQRKVVEAARRKQERAEERAKEKMAFLVNSFGRSCSDVVDLFPGAKMMPRAGIVPGGATIMTIGCTKSIRNRWMTIPLAENSFLAVRVAKPGVYLVEAIIDPKRKRKGINLNRLAALVLAARTAMR